MRDARILVIDDEPPVVTLLVRRLEQEGFICQSAHDADEALQYLRQGSFAAALVDIRMHGKDGITLLGEMKGLDPDLAAIMVTAIKDRESAVKAMKLGAEDYIVKPFDLDEVVTSLRGALDKRRLTLENRAYHQELERLVAERTRDLERRNTEFARANRRLHTLREIGASIVSTLSPDEALQRIADGVVAGLEYKMALIGVIKQRDQTLGSVAVSGASQGLVRQAEDLIRLPLSRVKLRLTAPAADRAGMENLISQVVERGEIAVTHDLYDVLCPAVEETECQALQRQIGARSLVVVPLQARGRMVGTIIIATEHEEVDEEELLQLQTFADQAAIAIENARLYQETLAAQKRSATILSEAFTGIMVVDAHLRLREFNPAAETITGYQAREVLGHPLWQFFGEDMYAEGSPLHRAITTGEQILPTETVITGRRGKRDILLGVTPLTGELAPAEYLLSFADITELKEVERLKTNIVTNVSHELRTPLASIRAYTELLMENLDEGDADLRQHFLEVIDQETQHLAGLITDLLNVARLESGRFEARKEDLSLRDVAEQVLARFQIQTQQRGIQLLLDAPSDLPHLLADAEMMGILFKNLISNAIKFSTHGGEVKVSLRADEEQQTLKVADQGIGIAPEDLPHIFEKFYQAHSSTESDFEGTGLGLTLVKEVVEAHSGSIEVQSERGRGTCFTITLPMRPSPPESDSP